MKVTVASYKLEVYVCMYVCTIYVKYVDKLQLKNNISITYKYAFICACVAESVLIFILFYFGENF